MIYVLTGLGLFIAFSMWCACAAASNADNITGEWNKNWTGQKFKKEVSKTKK